ncbi:hypothetical protein B0J11DRAFT_582477 [Dendryphion nanum]|uniref:Rhodopsin domain-containing protein n=1 Tax=Dendryphion nanum TaxID=256645 RepID=A0A9P9IHZ6_9PLEO|nr:hypothetical protein B0J11DRAFT_582477 [Dendryphion nanum]
MTELSSANVAHLTKAYRNRTITAVSICLPLAVLAVILRFIARKIARARIWYDDWLAFAGLIAVGVFVSLILVDLPDKGAIQGQPIPESTLMENAKTVYVAELFYYIIQFTLKLSILAFYWRLFNMSSIRVPIYFVASFIVAWFIASILVTVFQCVPVASLWTPALRASAKCVELAPFFFGVSIPNILADLFLLILPMPYVWRLKITITQKVFVMVFFLLGSFVLIASVIRLRLLLLLDVRGFYANWSVENAVFLSAIENCMSVICVCLPSLRPIVKLFPQASLVRKFLDPGHSSGSSSRGSRLEHGPGKAKEQCHDEYGLIERDRTLCWAETETSIEEHSIKTVEGAYINVRTKIYASSADLNQPAETV